MPDYTRLQPVTSNLDAPTALALDNQENIYVAESVNNKLLIFTQSGEYKGTLEGLNKPISVALDAAGRIFIGNKDSRNVEVYNPGLTLLFKLGSGDGEFTQPNDIAIDNAGKIYVADSSEDKIKIYNSHGSFNSSFGNSGSGDGQFHKPMSVEIDEAAGEILVLDRQVTYDQYGTLVDGARIQIFDMNGVYKKGFSSYGQNVGQMYKPQHITIDNEGRIYVTDTYHNVALVYDKNGAYLGAVFDSDNPLRTPMGVTIANSNRLFIASLNACTVEIYGLASFTNMKITPLALTFTAQQYGDNPPSQALEIINNGNEPLSWTASTTTGWITLSETSGVAMVSGTSTLNIGVNISGLSPNTYIGTVNISSASGSTEVIYIQLTVLPTPVLSVSPSLLEFTSVNGSLPSAQSLSITNAGEGTLSWTAASNSAWLSINKETGTAPDTISVSVNITSLGAGTYSGAITIAGENVLSSPAVIDVTLNIIHITGTIFVTTNIPGATFIINGPESYTGAGSLWSKTNATVGAYSIVFGDVDGYGKPSSQSQTLQADGRINFRGEYVSQVVIQPDKRKEIIVGAGPGEQNTGIVKVFDADGSEAGIEFIAHEYKYGVNVATGDINDDGVDEIITAPGPGPKNPAEVKIFDHNGDELTNLKIDVFEYSYGAHVGSGDFNCDGRSEVIVGTGSGAGNPAYVKVFVYDPTEQKMIDSGINLLAYDRGSGVKVAAGDVDNDGIDEIITAPGNGTNTSVIKMWTVNTSAGTGHWTVSETKEYPIKSRYGYSISLSAGDMNGDGYDEIVTGVIADRKMRDEIDIYDINGDSISTFRPYIARNYGVNIAIGDLDDDGLTEIVAGAGAGAGNKAMVKVFDSNGIEKAYFKALDTRYGVNVAVGNVYW
ncbi:MAG: VCBS repeat-containing protein [Nitrospirae bacterium]|nr:VCBS repeat-containing protein [Nitrospirota bacterium]